MLKKINMEQLKVGMFILALDRSWFNHPFFRNQMVINSVAQIAKLKGHGIREVTIDTDRGLDVINEEPDKTQTQIQANEEDATQVLVRKRSDAKPSATAPVGEDKSYYEELKKARTIHHKAQLIVKEIMNDTRLGKNLQSTKVVELVNEMTESIFRNLDALISLTRIKGYDEYTFVHSINVCVLCLTLGRFLNYHMEELQQIGIGALLHDIGKMKIPNYILNKPGKLTPEEFEVIKKHPLYAREILENTEGIPEASKQIALQHHERYGGKGYPFGLKKEQIGTFGQIAAIADVYDAITTNRSYRAGLAPHIGIKTLYDLAEEQFNPVLVQRFIQCVGIYPIGTLVRLDTGEIGIVYSVNHLQALRPKVMLIYKDSETPYLNPILVDLVVSLEDRKGYKRTITVILDPQEWHVNIEYYLAYEPRDMESVSSKAQAI